MKNLAMLRSLVPVHSPEVARDEMIGDEHIISVQTAQVLSELDTYVRSPRDLTTTDQVARIGRAVRESWLTFLSDEDRPRTRYDMLGKADSYISEAIALTKALRVQWHTEYYQARTHPTTKAEFFSWLDAYIEKYGEDAVSKNSQRRGSFEDTYRGKNAAHDPIDRGLRTADTDLVLIQGSGIDGYRTLEVPGTAVRLAPAAPPSHTDIFSLEVHPAERFLIGIPNDPPQH